MTCIIESARPTLACLFLAILSLASGCGDATGPSEAGPRIVALGPNQVLPGSFDLQLTVHGARFTATSVVEWDGAKRPTAFVNSTRLVASIAASDLATPATVAVRVRDGNRLSSAISFFIRPGASPLRITAHTPAENAESNLTDAITIAFSEDLAPESLDDSSLVISDGGIAIPAALSYDPSTRTVLVSATLEPLHQYEVTVTDRIRSPTAGALPLPLSWTFYTPRAPVVQLANIATAPSIALTADGRPHIAFSVASGHLDVLDCTNQCLTPTGWQRRTFDAGASGDYPRLVVGPDNTLHVAYQGAGSSGLSYGDLSASHTVIDVGTEIAYTALAVAPDGRIHIAYYGDGDLRHATCLFACLTSTSWARDTADTDGTAGGFAAASADSVGTLHIAYFENDAGDLRYATCPAPCSPANWSRVTIDSVGVVEIGPSIVTNAGGRHVVYLDATKGELRYATCSASCLLSSSWASTTIASVSGTPPPASFGFYGPSLALSPTGALAVAYVDFAKLPYPHCILHSGLQSSRELDY